MAIPGKSRYVMSARPGARAGMTLYCAQDHLASLWIRIVLAEKDVDSARIEWVTPGAPHPDLVILNPALNVPTLAERDTVIHPAGIISDYIDERYPHPRLLPPDPPMRARLRMVRARLEQELLPMAQTILDDPRGSGARSARKTLSQQLAASSGLFAQRGWCLGSDFSLVDCAWAALLSQLPRLRLKRPDQPETQRYLQRLMTRASVESVLR